MKWARCFFISLAAMMLLIGIAEANKPKLANLTYHKSYDNPYQIQLSWNGTDFTATDMSNISKVAVVWQDSQYADSDSCAACFDWTTYASSGILVLDLGGATFTAGRDSEAELIVYDAANTDGRVLGTMSLEILDDPMTTATGVSTLSTVIQLSDLNDVTTTGATANQVLTRESDGSYTFKNVNYWFYYADASEADQGATASAGSDTIYDFATAGATVVLAETDGDGETVYSLDTDLTIPADCVLKIENGAIIKTVTGDETLTVNGEIDAGDYSIFGSSLTVSGIPDTLKYRRSYQIFEDDVTFNVPTDYATVQTAIEALGEYKVIPGNTITINIETGHKLKEGIDVRNAEMSHIIISSTDATVYLDAAFVPVATPSYIPTTAANAIMYSENSHAPVFNILVDAELSDVCGVSYRHSFGKVGDSKGVKNANRMGLVISHSSNVMAQDTIWTNAGDGNRVTTGSQATLAQSDLSGARALTETQAACLDVSRGSIVNLASNSAQYAVGDYADCSGATKYGINCRRSWVSATYADCSSAGINAVRCGLGGHVILSYADLSDSVSHAINVTAGTVIADNADILNAGGRAINISDGGYVNVSQSDLSKADAEVIFATHGSRVAATGTDMSDYDFGSYGGNAIEVYNASIVHATSVTGTPTLNVTKNTISANGIIIAD